jgi:hypothetical protein
VKVKIQHRVKWIGMPIKVMKVGADEYPRAIKKSLFASLSPMNKNEGKILIRYYLHMYDTSGFYWKSLTRIFSEFSMIMVIGMNRTSSTALPRCKYSPALA